MNGADLMLPGLILPAGGVTLQTFCHVQRADLCSICLDDNRYPICLRGDSFGSVPEFTSTSRQSNESFRVCRTCNCKHSCKLKKF